jgi:anaerobic selenocysteine-containing dehydrogenase
VGPPAIFLHPDDADERGIAPGDHVRVWNDRGSFQAEAAVDEAARPGVAFTFKAQWPKLSPDGRNVNATTPERDTDLGGGPTFHDNRVQVELVRSRAGGEPAVPGVRARRTPAPVATR